MTNQHESCWMNQHVSSTMTNQRENCWMNQHVSSTMTNQRENCWMNQHVSSTMTNQRENYLRQHRMMMMTMNQHGLTMKSQHAHRCCYCCCLESPNAQMRIQDERQQQQHRKTCCVPRRTNKDCRWCRDTSKHLCQPDCCNHLHLMGRKSQQRHQPMIRWFDSTKTKARMEHHQLSQCRSTHLD